MGASKPATTTTNTTQNQTQSTAPNALVAPGMQSILTAAGQAYANTPKTGTYADPTANQQAAWGQAASAAGSMGMGVDQTRQLALDELSGKYLDPSSNPFISGAVNAAITPLRNQLGQNILTIGDAAQMGGAFGGDRQQLLAGQALSGFNRDAMNTAANMYYNNYTNERSLQQGAPALLDAANKQSLMGAQTLDTIGQEQQQQQMAKLASAIDAPWAGLDRYDQILQSFAPYSTTTASGTMDSKQVSTPASGGFGGFLSGAMGGASAGAALGPWGAGIGGLVGGLASLFGG